jgi:hypothetical protein
MKKIMFMMMPLFLTALIFGAGCDQDPSTTKDNSSSGGDDVVADVTIQAQDSNSTLTIDGKGIITSRRWSDGATTATADWTKVNKVRFIANGSAQLAAVPPVGDETWPVFVPNGKTLILSGQGNVELNQGLAPGAPAGATVKGSKIIVDGKLFVENGTLQIGTNPNTTEFEQIVLRNGSLRVYQGATLKYGGIAKVTSILKGDRSALKYGGIEFVKDGLLDLASGLPASDDFTDVFESFSSLDLSGVPSTFVIRETDPNEEENYITLAQVYANSGDAIVSLNQGDFVSSKYLIDEFSVRPDRLLIVNGSHRTPAIVDAEELPGTITIKKGLVYMEPDIASRSFEHKDVVVNGGVYTVAKNVYATNLTIASGAIYYNQAVTDIDNKLEVNGEGIFNELAFMGINESGATEARATVGRDGSLLITARHTFTYSPVINGTLELGGGGLLNPGHRIRAIGQFKAGDFVLGNGILNANTGSVEIDEDGKVKLIGDSTLEVVNSLEVYDEAQVSVGELNREEPTSDLENYRDALTLQNIMFNGAFTLTGGTESAQLTATGSSVRFGSASTITGALSGPIVFAHGTAGTEPKKSFTFDYQTLATDGAGSSLILGSDGQIVFGQSAEAETGISLTGGTYSVESDGAGTRFAFGQLDLANAEKGLGIGIGRAGAGNGEHTSLRLSPDSQIRFALQEPAQAYLLTGSVSAHREFLYTYNRYPPYDGNIPTGIGSGTESSLFAINGTVGSQIKIDSVVIAGSLGHVIGTRVSNAVPLFAYDSENLYGTAATGSLTVVHGTMQTGIYGGGGAGGSLTVDHDYTWLYTANGWVGTK